MATSITNTSVTTDNLTVDTDTIHVDSANNRVGIGTTSPAMGLHVEGSASSNNYGTRIANTDASGYSTIQMGGTDAGIYRNGSSQTSYGGASSLNLITVGAHPISFSTSNTVRTTIDGSGHVTQSYQPMLACQPDTSSNVTVPNSNSHIVGWKVVGGRQTFLRSGLTLSGAGGNTIANGNNTGRITFSTDGIYYFDCTIRFENTPGTGNIYVYFNGNTIHRQHVEEWTRYNYAHGRVSRCVQVSAGDYIEFALARANGIFSGSGDTVNWLTIIKVA